MSGGCNNGPACAPAIGADADDAGCSGGESFALRVLGDDMAPEFNDGEIIIIEPDGALQDGSFVLARHANEWIFRQLRRSGAGWVLHALNQARSGLPDRPDLPDLPDLLIADLSAVHGVVIQKAVPGRRKLTKFYT